MDAHNKFKDIDQLLKGVIDQPVISYSPSLRDLFDRRVAELHIAPATALAILEIERRSLNGILDGTQKRIDFVTLSKLAQFLNLPTTDVIQLYVTKLEANNKEDLGRSEKKRFLLNNFDLVSLMKVGFIDSIHDFDHIEAQINRYFGFTSVFDYAPKSLSPAFSEGALRPKNHLNREFWIYAAAEHLKQINNTYEFERKTLLEYFPKIRWHSTDIKTGLLHVSRALFKLGITLIYLPSLPTLHLRGATFAINNKPCIVLTDYRGFYPTLWFALIHELYHVLFDWEEIKINAYHLSDEETDLFTVSEKELEANNFARKYLFSNEKMAVAEPHIDNEKFIREYALENHVDPSIVYVFYAFDAEKIKSRKAWARAKRLSPDISVCLKALINNPWQSKKSIREISKQRRTDVFNNL